MPVENLLSLYGMSMLSAYYGLTDFGALCAGSSSPISTTIASVRWGVLRDGVAQRRLHAIEDIVDGLEHAPAAVMDQLAGRSRGRKMARL